VPLTFPGSPRSITSAAHTLCVFLRCASLCGTQIVDGVLNAVKGVLTKHVFPAYDEAFRAPAETTTEEREGAGDDEGEGKAAAKAKAKPKKYVGGGRESEQSRLESTLLALTLARVWAKQSSPLPFSCVLPRRATRPSPFPSRNPLPLRRVHPPSPAMTLRARCLFVTLLFASSNSPLLESRATQGSDNDTETQQVVGMPSFARLAFCVLLVLLSPSPRLSPPASASSEPLARASASSSWRASRP